MRKSAEQYIVALHEVIHTILSLEAENIDAEIAARDVAATARHIPSLDRAWRKEIGQ